MTEQREFQFQLGAVYQSLQADLSQMQLISRKGNQGVEDENEIADTTYMLLKVYNVINTVHKV
ncbi:hypothetical protein N7456_001662 [Penicillium angulare]|uniref:Uncharacterized protein n=1 Tax=Penicillium angulare TaxID=116970 RepID=A0A9W9KPK0_9EURO|nr:hypothetical protein N7456_001662 [Penicillium angulare]